ncbi:MAG TPA: MOSC domain-containing protein [Candidatus Acidoferrum sp.]|nr:MOSC domain-containing protein [Candidatus Acidoferrum sp.]
MIDGLPAQVTSVNVGGIARLETPRRTVDSAIVKRPVQGRVRIEGVNLAGDDQADRKVHGGVDRAVYAYAVEDYAWWEGKLRAPLAPGTFGENLTTAGIDLNAAVVGERWELGDAELQVSAPRIPCSKLAARVGDPRFVARFGDARRPGPYLRITRPGTIAAGDRIRVVARPAHGIRIVDVFVIYLFERARLGELLAAPELGPAWIAWIHEQLAAREDR